MNSTSTSRMMNRNFKVRVRGNGYNHFVGFAGLVGHIGYSSAKLTILEAFSSLEYKRTFKRRNGLRIDFYSK